MRPIFISYRRQGEDKVRSQTLARELCAAFGEDAVFFDDRTLQFGPFKRQILKHAEACRAMIIVVGPQWIARVPELFNPDDYVRQEVEIALRKNALIVPLLVDNAPMPERAKLPDCLTGLLDENFKKMNEDYWPEDFKKRKDELAHRLGLRIREPLRQIPNLSGKWRSTEGDTVTIAHRDEAIRLNIANWFGGTIGEGSGIVTNGKIEFMLRRHDLGAGKGEALVGPGGRQISGDIQYGVQKFGFSLNRM